MRDRDVLGLIALGVYLLAVGAALIPPRHDPDREGPRDPEPEPAPGDPYPACPHCGGGPVVAIVGGAHACRSCARVVRRAP